MAFIMAGGEKVMPYKSRVSCKYPGCGKLIQSGTMHCKAHTTLRNSQYEKYDQDKDTKRRYDRAWKRIRDKYAAEHPFCEQCYAKGVLIPTEEIHHKLPLSEDETYDKSNLIVLCKSRHSQIHAKRGARWGEGLHRSQLRGKRTR